MESCKGRIKASKASAYTSEQRALVSSCISEKSACRCFYRRKQRLVCMTDEAGKYSTHWHERAYI